MYAGASCMAMTQLANAGRTCILVRSSTADEGQSDQRHPDHKQTLHHGHHLRARW